MIAFEDAFPRNSSKPSNTVARCTHTGMRDRVDISCNASTCQRVMPIDEHARTDRYGDEQNARDRERYRCAYVCMCDSFACNLLCA